MLRMHPVLGVVLLLLTVSARVVNAAEHTGRVTFGEQGVPGATVTITQGPTVLATTTDRQGFYGFADVRDGRWVVRVEVDGFATVTGEIVLPADIANRSWPLKILTVAELGGDASSADGATTTGALPSDGASTAGVAPESATRVTADVATGFLNGGASSAGSLIDLSGDDTPSGLLLAGTIRNAAASEFAQPAAFGNFRPKDGTRQPYFFNITVGGNSSALNAAPYSRSGTQRPPDYGSYNLTANVSGPVHIPWLRRGLSRFQFSYQRSANENVMSLLGRVPTRLERAGVLDTDRTIFDPVTGQSFPQNTVPFGRINAQAAALLTYYPLPNIDGDTRTNFQATRVNTSRTDGVTASSGAATRSEQLEWNVSYLRSANVSESLFGFATNNRSSSIAAGGTWAHRFPAGFTLEVTPSVERRSNEAVPFFANRTNVSGDAGISGNNQEPRNWGLPNLTFAGAISSLADSSFSSSHARLYRTAVQANWTRRRHNIKFGGNVLMNRLDEISERNARGSFLFSGAITGSALADFLLGLPQSSTLAYGNAEQSFDANSFAAFIEDDIRLSASLTLKLGLRWEHTAPVTELRGRLVNLDVAPGFVAVTPVLASDPVGTLSGARYPRALVRSDWKGFEPRLSAAWRPDRTSSLVLRAGYDWTVSGEAYLPLARLMASQPPLSTTGNAFSTPERLLTLADGFAPGTGVTQNTFAVDPDFKPAFAQNWTLSAQRDLTWSLALALTYLGTHGQRLVQQYLPNTLPPSGENLCGSCPQGFRYVTSRGRSQRHAFTVEVRRRNRSGLEASLAYVLAKATDDSAAFGDVSGGSTAQDWLDLASERAPSSFDQRHRMISRFTWTTGVGVEGGAYIQGWLGRLVRGWTLSSQLTAGSGLPVTPLFLPATALSPPVRASLTGVASGEIPDGFYLNPAAYGAPAAGTWGDAGRNSARGPRTFGLDGSVSHTLRVGGVDVDARMNVTNVLNRVVYIGVDTLVGSPQFGRPTAVASMRRLNMLVTLRF